MGGLQDIAAAMSEKQLDRQVRRLMKDLGLSEFSFHPYGAGGYQEGYPDWTIAGPSGLMYRELKTQRGRPTPAQVAWLKRLQDLGVDADIWRPSDLLAGRIARELIAIAGVTPSPGCSASSKRPHS